MIRVTDRLIANTREYSFKLGALPLRSELERVSLTDVRHEMSTTKPGHQRS